MPASAPRWPRLGSSDGSTTVLAGAPGEAGHAGAAYLVRNRARHDLRSRSGPVEDRPGRRRRDDRQHVAAGFALDGAGADSLVAAPGRQRQWRLVPRRRQRNARPAAAARARRTRPRRRPRRPRRRRRPPRRLRRLRSPPAPPATTTGGTTTNDPTGTATGNQTTTTATATKPVVKKKKKKLPLCPLKKPKAKYKIVKGKRVKVKPAPCRPRPKSEGHQQELVMHLRHPSASADCAVANIGETRSGPS